MKAFKIWFIGLLLVCFIPAIIGAFVGASWDVLDFTTWKEQSRVGLVFLEMVWTGLFLFLFTGGVFD